MRKPFFFFAVTLQGHGPYEPEPLSRTPPTRSHAPVSEWAKGSILSYAEGVADADRGLKRLMDWASKRKRKTVIAFFGDHLPPLGPVYVETGFMKEPVASRKAPIAEMSGRARDAACRLVEPRRHGQGHRRDQPGLHPAAGSEDRRDHAIPITPASSARSTTASAWSIATC